MTPMTKGLTNIFYGKPYDGAELKMWIANFIMPCKMAVLHSLKANIINWMSKSSAARKKHKLLWL